MKFFVPPQNKNFIGRKKEIELLKKIEGRKKASLIVVHGRRRIGKTELIEQFFRKSNIMKFEGLQIQLNEKSQEKNQQGEVTLQIENCIATLGKYAQQESLFKNVKCKNWTEFFEVLSPYLANEKVTLYFEETQWLAAYQDDFCARLKPFWDDIWRHNPNLILVLSGSAPSFLVSQFLSNKALYNRSNDIIQLEPFSLEEVDKYLGKLGKKEKILAVSTVGGVPEYLNRISQYSSIFEGLCAESFSKNGYFVEEYDRVFVSSLSQSIHYRKIIELLSQKNFLTRSELAKSLENGKELGGSFSKILEELESCGFIEKYSSIHSPNSRNLQRYCIRDGFLAYYNRFIRPNLNKIKAGKFNGAPNLALNRNQFDIHLGLAFERWVRCNHFHIAKILGFAVVEYESGTFFNRAINENIPGFQADIVFIRKDFKVIIGEVKYGTPKPSVVNEVKEKTSLFVQHFPKYKNYTFERLLITASSDKIDSRIAEEFDHVINLERLFL